MRTEGQMLTKKKISSVEYATVGAKKKCGFCKSIGATSIAGYPPNTISGSRAPQLMCLTSKFSSFQGESEFIGIQERNWYI